MTQVSLKKNHETKIVNSSYLSPKTIYPFKEYERQNGSYGTSKKIYSIDVGCRSQDYFTLVKSNQLHVNPFVQKKLHLL